MGSAAALEPYSLHILHPPSLKIPGSGAAIRIMSLDSTLQSILLHPVTLNLLQATIGVLVIGFTPPSSVIRIAALPLILLCLCLIIPTCLEKVQRVIWTGLLAGNSTHFLLQYIETALLSKWSFETRGPSSRPLTAQAPSINGKLKNSGTAKGTSAKEATERLKFGYHTFFSYRYTDTPYEVKGVPPFSIKAHSYVPSRGEFLRRKAIIICVCYLTLDLATSNTEKEQNPRLFSAQNVPFFMRTYNLSTEGLIVRFATTLGLWVSLYCVIQLYMSTIAFVCVACGLDETKCWRPTFGSLSEAYTVRQFWG